jgi:aminoglycoside N3'-acetyltransferase
MGLPALTRAHLDECLRVVGVQAGDGLLVHSALQFLGKPEGGLQMVLDALLSAVGPRGTVVVPAFSFTTGGRFDVKTTPSKGMGVFSEHVRTAEFAVRTYHPMQSIAAIGAAAADLAGRDTPSAFDAGSAFARMLELDFKLLLLGADVQAASIVHWSEQRAAVPYRYWKQFGAHKMFVRDLKLDPQLKLAPIQAALERKGQWRSAALNLGQVSCCRLADFAAAADELLAADPWALVANKPERAR